MLDLLESGWGQFVYLCPQVVPRFGIEYAELIIPIIQTSVEILKE